MKGRTGRILLVDDDCDFRESLLFLLADTGYEVTCASDGEEALALLRSAPAPCLILLDLMMPRMNGWQFRDAQLRDANVAAIPVLVLSGESRAVEEARAIGAKGCFRKPVKLDALLESIALYC